MRVLWRTDYAPGKLNSAPIVVAAGRLLPVTLARDPNWIGRIRGIALLVQGPLPGPFRDSTRLYCRIAGSPDTEVQIGANAAT